MVALSLVLPQGKTSVMFVDHGRASVERDFTVGPKHSQLTLDLEARSGITFRRPQTGWFLFLPARLSS